MLRTSVININVLKSFFRRQFSVSPSKTMQCKSFSKSPGTSETISICHMRATNNKVENRAQVEEIVKISKEKQSKFVFLPECCDYVGSNVAETLKLAETLSGDTIGFYKQLAKTYDVWLSIGGFHELTESENKENACKIYNCHVIINNVGELVESYRKLHLYDVDTPEYKFRESKVVQKGPNIVPPLDTPIGVLGLMICYDLRFPELSTILRKHGAQVLTYPSAFAYSTGTAHWHTLLRARAIENQCFVIASAQNGYHNEKRRSYGHALVVDPWGKIIAECDSEKELDVVTVDIDLDLNLKTQRNMPCFEHRRNDIYSLVPVEVANCCSTPAEFYFESNPIPPETIFYESSHSVAFTNIRCVVPGHVLVASKRRVLRLTDLEPDEIADFFQTVCKVQKVTDRFHKTQSSTVTVQDGVHAGQTVPHVHCHIMPRKPNDFPRNDEIYVRLGKHDTTGNAPRRPLTEMIEEANGYRNIFKNL